MEHQFQSVTRTMFLSQQFFYIKSLCRKIYYITYLLYSIRYGTSGRVPIRHSNYMVVCSEPGLNPAFPSLSNPFQPPQSCFGRSGRKGDFTPSPKPHCMHGCQTPKIDVPKIRRDCWQRRMQQRWVSANSADGPDPLYPTEK